MGRNSQKRLAKKARAAADRPASAADRASSRVAVEELPRPLWLFPDLSIMPPVDGGDAYASFEDAADAGLLELAGLCAAHTPPDTLASFIAELCVADAVLIARARGQDLQALGSFRRARSEAADGLLALLSPSLIEDVLATRTPTLIRDVARDSRTPAIMPNDRTGSLLAAPLYGDGETPWGLIVVGRREVGALFARDEAVIARLAEHLGPDLAQARALALGLTDSQTGLLSRQALLLFLERELEQARRRDHPLTAVLFEIDPASAAPASAGRDRDVPTEHLAALARRLVALVRSAEISGHLVGGEILLLLEADATQAVVAVRRTLEDLTNPQLLPDLDLTLSVGLAQSAPGDTCGQLLTRTRTALKSAQAAGGARIVQAAWPSSAQPSSAQPADKAPDEDAG